MAGNEKTRVTIQVDVTNEGELKTLIADLERIAKGFPKAAKQAEKFAKTTKKTQIEMRKFGRGMQNASYQVQDFIVQ